MSEQDAEIEQLKASVSCATLLERLPPVWRLDRAESTRHSLKYRRGPGEILIVNHGGHGWWDPLSDHKGDIFTLVQHLDPGLTFGAARRVLRDFVGIAPTFPEAVRTRWSRASHVPVAQRWEKCRPLSHGSPAWLYLTGQRGLREGHPDEQYEHDHQIREPWEPTHPRTARPLPGGHRPHHRRIGSRHAAMAQAVGPRQGRRPGDAAQRSDRPALSGHQRADARHVGPSLQQRRSTLGDLQAGRGPGVAGPQARPLPARRRVGARGTRYEADRCRRDAGAR
jgi:hypothetical protein